MHKKIFILILIEQITKLIFWSRDFFLGILHVHPEKNYGLIFNLNFGLLNNLIILFAVLLFFIYYYTNHRFGFSLLERLGFIFIFAGATSNIIDRLYLGYVRDFLDVGLGFTFNFADAMVVIGLLLILLKQNTYEKNLGN